MAAFLVLLAALLFPIASCSLTSSEKEEILNAHNYYRGHVDPIATDMLRMVRDSSLIRGGVTKI